MKYLVTTCKFLQFSFVFNNFLLVSPLKKIFQFFLFKTIANYLLLFKTFDFHIYKLLQCIGQIDIDEVCFQIFTCNYFYLV